MVKRLTMLLPPFILTAALTSPLLAATPGHTGCAGDPVVDVPGLGDVDEAILQARIDSLQANLERVAVPRKARAAGHAQRQRQRRQLAELRMAMADLHADLYRGGCAAALHGVSLEQRLAFLEQRVAAQEQGPGAGH